jgi:catechol 2,3-dioxygenase-like lactoylglutathione lyase family enzyme
MPGGTHSARLGQREGMTPERRRGRIRSVLITYTFAGLPVTDYEAAYEWYVRLIGRPADMFPHATEAVWRLTANSAIYVVQDPERAGRGLLTVALNDLDTHATQLRETGLAFTEVSRDEPRRLVVIDPDGNTLAFFQDPAQRGA